MLVCRVVVDDQVGVKIVGYSGLDVAQERQKLLVPMAWLALRDDRTVDHIEHGEQRRRAVADVIVSTPSTYHRPIGNSGCVRSTPGPDSSRPRKA